MIMRLAARHRRASIIAALMVLGIAAAAVAYFSTSGTGTAHASVGTLSAPSNVSASPGAGSVSITWSGVTPPATGTIGYYVSRDGSPVGGSCGSPSAPVSGTSCTDSGLAKGTYSYTVTAVWQSWTATSGAQSATLASGAATMVAVSAGSPQAAAVGTAFGTAMIALVTDSSGNPVSGATVTFTAPPSGASGKFANNTTTTTTTTASDGKATASTFTANTTAGSYNVTASVTGATSANFALTNTAGPASTVAVSAGSPQSAPVGGAFSAALVALVTDSSGNPVSGATVTFTAPTSGASGKFANNTTTTTVTTGSDGKATASAFTANTIAGSYNVAASVTGATSANFALTNTAGLAATVSVSAGSPQSAQVGGAFATALVALVSDSNGNPVSGATVTFTAPSTGASGKFANNTTTTSATTGSDGKATASTFTANTTAGSYNVTASATGATSANFVLTNTPGAVTSLAVTGYPSPVVSATSNSFRVTAKDQFGNTVTGYAGTVAFSSSDASAGLPSNYTFTTTGSGKDNGTHVFSATLKQFGSQSITATDTVRATITGSQTGIVVTASQFALTAASTSPTAGVSDNLTIKAQDALGNVDTGYTGSHNLNFSGVSASPNNTQSTVTNSSGTTVTFGTATSITFTNGQATVTGSSNGVMTLYTSGTSSVVVSDGTINNGSGLSVTVAAAVTAPFNVTYMDPNNGGQDTVSGTTSPGTNVSATETAGDHVGNVYNGTSASSNGRFTINVENYNGSSSSLSFTYSVVGIDAYGNQTASSSATGTDTH